MPAHLNLKQQLRRKIGEVELLHRLSETVSSTLDLDAILRHLADMVADVTRADACLLYLLDSAKGELVLRASKNRHPKLIGRITLEMGEGITGWVAKERTPVKIARHASDDPRFKFFHNLPEDRYQAFLSTPMIHHGRVVGVINVQHKRPHQHTPDEVALIETIARHAGAAIENARLFASMKEKARQVEMLSQVSQTIASNRYLEEILQLIVTMTAQVMGSAICAIMLVDDDRQQLSIKATQSLSDAYRNKPPLRIGESISGRAVKERRPLAVLDVTREPGYMYPDVARKEGLCSLLSVPMMMKDRVIGVINSYTSQPHPFAPEEIQVLSAVANQAAVAIEHTRLMERSLAMQEALESRKLVERAKGMLMRQRGISEELAFQLLQRQSMNSRKSMREVAEAVLLATSLHDSDRR
ncbi:MAG: GAF and ANTAR domain-containing protein [Nitrospirae bacterium]|nr:GAF and ANTAR domain-containing protein [Nitrospirota bacterium]